MVRIRDVVVVGGGLLGLALVAVLFVQPSLLFQGAPTVAQQFTAIDPALALVIAGGVLVLLAILKVVVNLLQRGYQSTGSGMEPPESRAARQSLYTNDTGFEQLGAGLDDRFQRAIDYQNTDEQRRQSARDSVVERLRDAATTAYAQSTGQSPEDAADAIATGEWTDDRRAAGLLSDDEGPSIPVHLWLLDLLLGRDPFVAGVERSLAAIAAVNDDNVTTTDSGFGWPAGVGGR